VPQQFADPEVIAREQQAERARQLARDSAERERERREYEVKAAAQRAWAQRRDELQRRLVEARHVLGQVEGRLESARQAGDFTRAVAESSGIAPAQELVSRCDRELRAHLRQQP
jgi:chromatin segregation and condensation protein Rec8/ScpA/Scc1 (kleisin family)